MHDWTLISPIDHDEFGTAVVILLFLCCTSRFHLQWAKKKINPRVNDGYFEQSIIYPAHTKLIARTAKYRVPIVVSRWLVKIDRKINSYTNLQSMRERKSRVVIVIDCTVNMHVNTTDPVLDAFNLNILIIWWPRCDTNGPGHLLCNTFWWTNHQQIPSASLNLNR